MRHRLCINGDGKAGYPAEVTWSLPVKPYDGQTVSITYHNQVKPNETYMYWGSKWYRIWQP